jgi:uncharacterized membrane protein
MTIFTATEVQIPNPTVRFRVESIDVLRGLLMIVMALDHARQFFTNVRIDPTDPLLSWPALFLTRWVTHLCAPGFVALSGASVYLQRQRGRSAQYMTRKLIARGLWLIFFELTFVNFAIYLNLHTHMLQVIWAIGASMLVLAFLQRLPVAWVAAYGFLAVALHNWLDVFHASQFRATGWLWMALHEHGVILLHGRPFVIIEYPLLPWTGVIALGYAFGAVVVRQPRARQRWCWTAGAISLVLFAVLRATNLYGDPVPFRLLGSAVRSAMSFLDVTKYPPSLDYLLATCGILLFLYSGSDALLEQRRMKQPAEIVRVYGSVPFFFYVLHLYLLHLLLIPIALVIANRLHVPLPQADDPQIPAWWGFSLPVVYIIWIAVVIALYPACRWFSMLKSSRRDWWLSYL